jgi:hypothetical protein
VVNMVKSSLGDKWFRIGTILGLIQKYQFFFFYKFFKILLFFNIVFSFFLWLCYFSSASLLVLSLYFFQQVQRMTKAIAIVIKKIILVNLLAGMIPK